MRRLAVRSSAGRARAKAAAAAEAEGGADGVASMHENAQVPWKASSIRASTNAPAITACGERGADAAEVRSVEPHSRR